MEDIEEYLNQIPMWAAKKNSLEDIRAYMEELGNPDESMKIIHVAGTNGKGSVCEYLTSVLTEAGYKVGTFISPHLEETRERFLINGEMVYPDTYQLAFKTVRKLVHTMRERGYEPPTYFEFLFYMSMVINAQSEPDFVILETGIGGRLDVTNVIRRPALVVLTSISMDHMEYLGNTIEEITREKAGIMKPGVPVVFDAFDPKVAAIIKERAEELHCPIHPVTKKNYMFLSRSQKSTRITVRSCDGGQLVVDVPSVAEYQLMNVAVAVKALGVLKKKEHYWVTSEDVSTGIRRSYWPGRMEQVLPGVYLDGAHNVGGMNALVKTILQLQQETGKQIHLLFAVVSDKEYQKMIQSVCQGLPIKSVSVAHMITERGLDTEVLVQEFQKVLDCPVTGFQTAEEALEHLLAVKEEGDLAFCVGSLYLIGEIKQILRRKEHD